MKFLLVVKQERNAAAFLQTLRHLVERGHVVTLAVQERDEARDRRLEEQVASERFTTIPSPAVRTDEWASAASLLRRLRDGLHYLRPVMRPAIKLQARMVGKLHREVMSGREAGDGFIGAMQAIPADSIHQLEAICRLAEHSLPTAPLFDEFLAAHRPDVLLLSPLVHFGSAQADLVASARRLGIGVQMLMFSWDNLSTKGRLHRQPDLIYVWNERQRREAEELHGFPSARVVVVGAPRFDPFFALAPQLDRGGFHRPLRLDADRPTLLYVCSSKLIADGELAFVRRWLQTLRASASPALRGCNVIVRPHPDVELLPAEAFERHRWPAAPLTGHVARPFDDERALVLKTRHNAPDGLFESIVHSTAVVGLNTTAELEAGIVGRPVFTILDEDADGQAGTMHFHYLTREQQGFVEVAGTLAAHAAQLDAALQAPIDPAPIRAFIESFLRPLGFDRPVAPLLADAIERHAGVAPQEAAADSALGARPVLVTPPARRDDGSEEPLRESAVSAATLAWLDQHVSPGQVVYDVNAGTGAHALAAAERRGAIVVAFEPAYRAFGALCEKVRSSRCQGSIIPLPVALAERDGLIEMKYQTGGAGEARYRIRNRQWRVRPVDGVHAYVQPVCATTLDAVVARFHLPQPNHLLLSPRTAPAVLAGAHRLLQQADLVTLCLHPSADDEAPMLELLARLGWSEHSRSGGGKIVQVVVRRNI